MGAFGKLSYRFISGLLILLANFDITTSGTCRTSTTTKGLIVNSCTDYDKIPPDIPDPFKVHKLKMSRGNLIHTLTGGQLARANLTRLIDLSLANCSIHTIEMGAFTTENTTLKLLDLNNNKIEFLDPDAFAGLTNLITLILENNPIKRFETDKVFPLGLPSLADLYLNDCQLSFLPEKAFDNLNISMLLLSNNNLKTVSWRTFRNLNLTLLSLRNNPWHCDCHFKFLIEILSEKNVLMVKLTKDFCVTFEVNGLTCDSQIEKVAYGHYSFQSTEPQSIRYTDDRNSQVTLSQDVYIECTYSGFPRPQVLWLKDERIIYLDQNSFQNQTNVITVNRLTNKARIELIDNSYDLVQFKDEYEKEKNYRFSVLLIIRQLRKEDRGKYTCMVTNPAGYVQKTIFLNFSVASMERTVVLNFTTPSIRTNEQNIENTLDIDWKLIIGIVPAILLISSVFMIILWLKFARRVKRMQFQQRDTLETIPLNEQNSRKIEFRFDQQHELDILSDLFIDIDCILGKGNFGTVYKGRAKGKDVAIKKLNNSSPSATINSLIGELKVLSSIGIHENVISFIGAYTKEVSKGILYIVMEVCSNGSLLDFLRTKNDVSFQTSKTIAYVNLQQSQFVHYRNLCKFSSEIATGMEYIAAKKIVHADLSARNVLLDAENVCKIGDFGLARNLYEYLEYVKTSHEPLPWKWMAYESLTRMEFTSKSDVWSFGVTMWEIFSLGKVPYAGLRWTESFGEEIRKGLRPSPPQYATSEIYAKMSECWKLNAEERPSFSDLVQFYGNTCEMQYENLNWLCE